jgi:hypothetical protein
MVLVTLQCTSERCLNKYPVMKSEHDLTDREREVWRNRP